VPDGSRAQLPRGHARAKVAWSTPATMTSGRLRAGRCTGPPCSPESTTTMSPQPRPQVTSSYLVSPWRWVIGRLGDIATKLPEEITEATPDVPWRQVKGMRIIAAHAYHCIDVLKPPPHPERQRQSGTPAA
jgi:hypothetical protein